jgi:hypothetical protein
VLIHSGDVDDMVLESRLWAGCVVFPVVVETHFRE